MAVVPPLTNSAFDAEPVSNSPVVQKWTTAYIGLGANLGDAKKSVLASIQAIAQLNGVKQLRASSLYGSAPVLADGGNYVNAVVEVQTVLPPVQLLEALQGLETCAGRQRSYHNAPRTLDLDVLLYGDSQIKNPVLEIPHPRMWERAFVLHPLAELMPTLVTPAQLQGVADQAIWLYPIEESVL